MVTHNTASPLPPATGVLIVGAGPAGLALALSLQRAGISHVIVDKLPQGLNTSRAGVIHAHTLDVLSQLGVSNELVRHGLPISRFRIRDGDRMLLQLGFESLPSPHPYLLMLPQDCTERILAERIEAAGGFVHRGYAATALHRTGAGVEVTLQGPSGQAVVTAGYVVGADGMHSLVRDFVGTPFEGSAYADSFVLADVRMDWPFGNGEVSFFFSPAGLVVVAPLPGKRYRVVATVAEAPPQPSMELVQSLLDSRGPRQRRARVLELLWSSRFRVHHRLARHYRSGRFFLMGDAAHVHSPAGGQGMNTGLVDAVVLGELLRRAIRNGDDSILDEYERLRRPAAEKVLRLSARLTAIGVVRDGIRRWLRNAALSFLNAFAPGRNTLVRSLSGLSRAALASLPPDIAPSAVPVSRLQPTSGGRQ
ncbi:MAG: NAD(P)/FAD-dependent oxidoreductase [Bryobacteraceae bacterium]